MTCRGKSSCNTCISGCVNPSAGLHHLRCPNSVAPPDFESVRRANGEIAEREMLRRVFTQTDEEIVHMINAAFENSRKIEENKMNKLAYIIQFQSIIETFEHYGYTVYTKDDLHPVYWDKRDFKDIATKLYNNKSVFLYYLTSPLSDYDCDICNEILGLDISDENDEPFIIVGISLYDSRTHDFSMLYLPCENFFKDYTSNEKIRIEDDVIFVI
jgi:hypothetical protein